MRRFRKLVEIHKDRVYSTACYLMNNREDAEDVTQEVLLRMWKNLDSLNDDRVGSWLLKVTRNACIDAHRRRKTLGKVIEVNSDGITYENAAAPDGLPDAGAEASDFQEHLRVSIAQLPEPHRSIVVCREIEEMKYEEIAEALELPLNTVKVYLHRARKMLRDQLRERLDYVTG